MSSGIVVRLLLAKTFVKMLVTQVHLKLTKFTRRSNQPSDLLPRVYKTVAFVSDMGRYNLEVIRVSRSCIRRLAESGVYEVSLYGERHVIEVLRNLALDGRVEIKKIYGDLEFQQNSTIVALEESVNSSERVIIASLVDVDSKTERLRALGVDEDRIVLLTDPARGDS